MQWGRARCPARVVPTPKRHGRWCAPEPGDVRRAPAFSDPGHPARGRNSDLRRLFRQVDGPGAFSSSPLMHMLSDRSPRGGHMGNT